MYLVYSNVISIRDVVDAPTDGIPEEVDVDGVDGGLVDVGGRKVDEVDVAIDGGGERKLDGLADEGLL